MIFGAFERMVAMRYLRARRQEGFISVIAGFSLLGIGLGVATLIIVMAVMNGFREELLTRILGVNGHMSVFAHDGRIEGYDDLVRKISAVEEVVSATPQIHAQVMITAGERTSGGLVRGVKPEDLRAGGFIAENLKQGDLAAFQGQDSVVIGTRLADKMGIKLGDSLTLISPSGDTTVLGPLPRLKSYQVVALFEVGMYEYDSGFVYMPLEAAQVFFRLKGAANAIEVFLDKPEAIHKVRWRVQDAVGTDYRTYDWQQSNRSFFNAIQVERNVMFLILSLIILVAAFNILSGQTMLVKDKGRDIAILRTMGATRGMVHPGVLPQRRFSIGLVGTHDRFHSRSFFCQEHRNHPPVPCRA